MWCESFLILMVCDQLDLVLSLIFANEKAFQHLNKKQCKNIVLTFRKELTQSNRNIVHGIIKIRCEILNKKIHKNTLSLLKAERVNNVKAIRFYTQKQEEFICKTQFHDIASYFEILFIAEYKELIYKCMFDPHYDNKIDNDILERIEAIVYNMYTQNYVYCFRHQPTHFLLSDKYYSYYEQIESNGLNIMHPWDACYDYYDEDL